MTKGRRDRAREHTAEDNVAQTGSFAERFHTAAMLLDNGRPEQAAALLTQLAVDEPDNALVREMAFGAAVGMQDVPQIVRTGERLAKITPNNPDMLWSLALAYGQLGFHALTARDLRHLYDIAPRHPRAGDARKLQAALQDDMRDAWAEDGPFGKEGFANAVLHQQLQVALWLEAHEEVERMARVLLERLPAFIPAMNNLSLSFWLRGDQANALTWTTRALEIEPDNVQALSDLLRMQVLRGELVAAAEIATRLNAIPREDAGKTIKLLESLSYLGDDAGIITAFEQEIALKRMDPIEHGGMFHYAAVAYARRGDMRRARALWHDALIAAPSDDRVHANLADFEHAVAERHAPFAFTAQYWIREDLERALGAILRRMQAVIDRRIANGAAVSDVELHSVLDNQTLSTALQEELSRQHVNPALLPHLLAYGDAHARALALGIAIGLDTPEMHAALLTYCQSQHGPDALRMDALLHLQRKAPALVRNIVLNIWQAGQWHQTRTVGYAIVNQIDEPVIDPKSALGFATAKGYAAIKSRRWATAELRFREATQLDSNNPRWHNNLAHVLEMQGRLDEAMTLIRTILTRHPDYLYACTRLAIDHADRGRFDAALDVLETAGQRSHMHTSEHIAYVRAHVLVLGKHGDFDAADNWISQLSELLPDLPMIGGLRKWLAMQRKQHRSTLDT
jgi:Flp pilus assembly protein TadD